MLYKKSAKKLLEDIKATITGFVIAALITNIKNVIESAIEKLYQNTEQFNDETILMNIKMTFEDPW